MSPDLHNKQPAAWLASAMLLLVAVVWGSSYGVAKGALLWYPVLGFLAIRFCLTSALLFLSRLRAWRHTSMAEAGRILATGVPLGLILLSIFICETYGVKLTQASSAAFLISLCVVFTPFVEWLLLRQQPGARALLAAAVSLGGAWLLAAGADGISLAFGLGDWLILGAALLRALMVTATKKLTARHPVAALTLTAVQTGVVGVGCLLLAVSLMPASLPALPQQPAFWWAMLYLVVFCTIFAFFAQNYAVRRTSPTRVSLLMGSEPVFGALFAVLWLGESLSLRGWAGGGMIVAASLWAATS